MPLRPVKSCTPIAAPPRNVVLVGDCLEVLRALPDNCVDLVFTSPPYEDARTYGIDFKLVGQDYVDWCVVRYMECLRVCSGLVAWVIEGRTKQFKYTAAPLLLAADLHRAGVHLRKPPIYYRSGIPGSGGPDWLRNDYEPIICATKGGKLPWSDNTVMGKAPVCEPGGDPTNRTKSGERVRVSGMVKGGRHDMPHATHGGRSGELNKDGTITRKDGSVYQPPSIANPGNVIRCSGGHLGSNLAHENEAPFPESLAEFFVKSFCPPGGIVLDPFCGSGTVGAVAVRTQRNYLLVDVRDSQRELTLRRLAEVRNA